MSLRAGDRSELKENMTFHFMTGLWQDDWGLEITESIVIGKAAAELLTNTPRRLLVKD
jgi:ectoine hydrolase